MKQLIRLWDFIATTGLLIICSPFLAAFTVKNAPIAAPNRKADGSIDPEYKKPPASPSYLQVDIEAFHCLRCFQREGESALPGPVNNHNWLDGYKIIYSKVRRDPIVEGGWEVTLHLRQLENEENGAQSDEGEGKLDRA